MPTTPSPHRHRLSRRAYRRGSLLALLLTLATLLSGCSLDSLGMGSTPQGSTQPGSTQPGSSTATGSSRTSNSDSAGTGRTNTTTARFVRGSLAAGTVTHKITIGSRHLVVTYWTKQNVGTWTSAKPAAVNVSAHLEDSSRSVRVLVTNFAATFTPSGSGQVIVLRRDQGRFVLTPPYSYATALIVPAVASSTRSALANIEIDLLVETSKGSHEYARQTVLDTLHFTYVAATERKS